MLKHTVTEESGVTVLSFLEEKLDATTALTARPILDQLVERGGIKVVIDMSAVRVIDSSGVAVVVSLFKRLKALGGSLRVSGLEGQPREIFHLLRLEKAMPIYSSAHEALKGY